MSRLSVVVIMLALALCGAQGASYAAALVSSEEMIEQAAKLDGKHVAYKGEAITAILDRGRYSWVNVNDGTLAIGIWCPTSMLSGIRFVGDYKHRGDFLLIEGIFNRACAQHNGELDIHAVSVRVIRHGGSVEERFNPKKLRLSFVFFFAALLIVLVFRKRILAK